MVDTVSRISPHNTVTLGFGNLLNLVTNFSVRYTRFADGDSLIHSPLSGIHQVLRFFVDLADWISGVEIAVEPSVVYCQSAMSNQQSSPLTRTQSHIKVDNIILLQRSLIGNTVANDFVNTCTYTLGELDVVERTGIGISVDTGLMANGIEFIGRDTGFDVGGYEIEHFPSKLCLKVRNACRGRHQRRTRQTFRIPSISSLFKILGFLSLTASHADIP